MAGEESRDRLTRELGVADAVVIGLGSMVGAGVFAAIAPAAAAAGGGLTVGLLVAGAVAYCNATSSAQLAALYPESGGTYVYGRRRLGRFWGWLAGWGFVTGKLASCAAMALTFGSYTWPSLARPLAIASVVALTTVNYRGIRKTALLTRLIVALVFAVLAVTVIAALGGGPPEPQGLSLRGSDARGVLQAAGLLFFAFAGYARIATLGEEVREPRTTIPRAIPLALGIALATYALVAVSALLAIGPNALAEADAPLAAAVAGGRFDAIVPVVRAGAAVASLGVLLSLIAGISRTWFAMASDRELPSWFGAVHPRFKVPHRAEVTAAAIVCAALLVTDLRSAIGFSSFNVLVYYGIANASAWTLGKDDRRWPRWLAAAGVAGCAALALSLPPASMAAGAGVLVAGAALHTLRVRVGH